MRITRQVCLAAMLASTSLLHHAHAAGSEPSGAPTPTTVKLPSGPGSVRGLTGDPSVNVFTGQASYAIPLELPEAARGFAPKIEIAYRGDLGNGPLGIGWGIAMPRIVRSTRQGVPKYLSSDELELVGVGAGGRLVSIAAGEWRIEGQGHAVRVVQNGAGFTVFGPDGTRYELGVSAGARQDSAGKTAAWLVEQTTDVAGQSVGYTYAKDLNEIYPARVTWGPNSAFAAVFELAPRADAVTSYALGFAVTTRQRIGAVRVESFGEVQRRYELAYDDSFALSRLASVRVTGRGGQDALPTTTFHYAQRPVVAAQPLGTGDWRLDQDTILVDVDGDGAADLLRMASTGHSYRQNRAGQFADPVAVTGATGVTLSTSRLADVEGRARPNLVTTSFDGWHPYRIVGTSWSAIGTWQNTTSVPINGSTVVMAELNGDNRVDVIQWNSTGLIVRYGNAAGLDAPVSKPKIGGTQLPSSAMRWHDVNGDGLSDALLVQDANILVYYGLGDGTFTAPQTVAWPWGGTLGTSDVRFADLDRDGLLDLVKVNLGDIAWYRGTPGGGFLPKPMQIAHPVETGTNVIVAIDDANGNGSMDVIWSSASGMQALDLAGATTAGMLTSIDNGMGKTVTFSYDATTALAGRDAAAGTPWTWLLPIAIPVVVQTVTASGAGDPARTVDFTLRDGFWDAIENRFGGFLVGRRTVRGAGSAPDLIEETRFHSGTGPTRVLRGMPVSVRVENGAGNLVSITTNTWRAARVGSLPDVTLLRKAVLDRTVIDHYDGLTSPISTRTSYTIDGEGRTSGEYEEGRLDITGDESQIQRTFADDTTLWVRDLIAEEKRLEADGTIVSWQRTYFGDATTELPLGQAGRGWARRVEAWLASTSAFVTRSQTDYDALGNVVRQVTGGVEHHTAYDADGLHAIREAITTDDGELAWTTAWDLVLGLPTARTGPDGVTTHVAYDGVGRVISEAVGTHLPHRLYRYTWTAPRPRTETFEFDGALDSVTALPATWTAGAHWRHTLAVANGASEALYTATQLADAQWIVRDWTERDAMGQPAFLGDAVVIGSTDGLLTARPPGITGETLHRDALGRPLEQTLATGAVRRFAYTAFTTTTTEDGLAPVTITKDGIGRPIENRRESELARARYNAAGNAIAFDVVRGTQTLTQTFTYDTLGRLVASTHPDGGGRTFAYDGGDRVVLESNAANQHVASTYDAAGRLQVRTIDGGPSFTYHYDAGGRLASVDEPTGRVDLAYDELGRLTRRSRTIDGIAGTTATTYSASGLVLGMDFDVGAYSVAYGYDAAGRLVRAGDVWSALDQDAAGRPLDEQFGNGVRQTTTRDALGLPSAIAIQSGSQTVYQSAILRTPWGSISSITDGDGTGLDHGATYTYDARGRLVASTMAGESLAFSYDDFQNMTARTATGPAQLGAMLGTYRYGESAHGARQLTSIVDGAGTVLHSFDYDAAGRQTRADGRSLSFDALDQLTRVDDAAGGVAHAYGYDGERIRTTLPDGTIQRWFTAENAEVPGGRDYHVVAGNRVLARVRVVQGPTPGPVLSAIDMRGPVLAGAGLLVLVALGLVRPRARRRGGRLALLVTLVACSPHVDELASASTITDITYFHYTTSPGPLLFTGVNGAVVEERIHEPFGVPIGAQDIRAFDLGVLGRRVEPTTGWSLHGARWYAPEAARWLSVDPPTRMPDAAHYLAEPWSLHPYQYVDQNPVVYWDPDGRDPKPVIIVTKEKRDPDRPMPPSELEAATARVNSLEHALAEHKEAASRAFDRAQACEAQALGCAGEATQQFDDELANARGASRELKSARHDLERLERHPPRDQLDPNDPCYLGCGAQGVKYTSTRTPPKSPYGDTPFHNLPAAPDMTPYSNCTTPECVRGLEVTVTGSGVTLSPTVTHSNPDDEIVIPARR